MTDRQTFIDTPVGTLTLVASDDGLSPVFANSIRMNILLDRSFCVHSKPSSSIVSMNSFRRLSSVLFLPWPPPWPSSPSAVASNRLRTSAILISPSGLRTR